MLRRQKIVIEDGDRETVRQGKRSARAAYTRWLEQGMEGTPDRVRRAVAMLFPRVVGHLMAKSLGYFSAEHAVLVVLNAKQGERHYCELFSEFERGHEPEFVREYIDAAVKQREHHTGYMSEAAQGVQAAMRFGLKLDQAEPQFAGWF